MTSLIAKISGIMDSQGIENGALVTPVPGLRLLRTHDTVAPRHMSYRPSLCVVAQGAKEMLVGDRTVTYGEMQSLVVTVEVPVLSQIVGASREKPYLGAVLELNTDIILDVVTRLEGAGQVGGSTSRSSVRLSACWRRSNGPRRSRSFTRRSCVRSPIGCSPDPPVGTWRAWFFQTGSRNGSPGPSIGSGTGWMSPSAWPNWPRRQA